MMKKTLMVLAAVAAISFASCTGNSTGNASDVDSTAVDTVMVDTAAVDTVVAE